jgi:uncharacterized FlaG/YvyC family protein
MDVTSLNTMQLPVATAVTAAISTEEQAQNRQLIRAVRAVNGVELYGQDSVVTFVLDQAGHPLLQVVNRKTKEVIRQIPPQDVLSAAKSVGLSG